MIIFPMAGMSSRFINEGYSLPKYMLPAHGQTVFHWVMHNFVQSELAAKERLLLIGRSDFFGTKEFISSYFSKINFYNYEYIELLEPTSGQAETVFLGLKNSNYRKINEPVTIFNIDTIRKKNFSRPVTGGLNYLEVFNGEGEHWSFAKIDSVGKVIEVAEKKRISNLCSTGLYGFESMDFYIDTYNKTFSTNKYIINNEKYIAPMYQYLISNQYDVRIDEIDSKDLIFCGVPAEYEEFKNCNEFVK